jgi:hypothetical protein
LLYTRHSLVYILSGSTTKASIGQWGRIELYCQKETTGKFKKKAKNPYLYNFQSSHPLRLPTSLFCLLLRSTSAWACWIAAFCYFYALLSMLIFYPIFLHKVLRQTVESSIITPLGMLVEFFSIPI